jgi:hypothetical protein
MHELEQHMNRFFELDAAKIQHIGSDLLTHLRGTADLLAQWGGSIDLCRAGLVHAAYGTDGFPRPLIDTDRRADVAAIIGTLAEEIVYFYGACDRTYFYRAITQDTAPRWRNRFTTKVSRPSRNQVANFCELTLANELEIAIKSPAHWHQYGADLRRLFDDSRFQTYVSPLGSECWNAFKLSRK